MIFELIVVDTPEQAKCYPIIHTETHVQRAVFVGEGLCGVRYKASRPNKLTRLHRPLATELERLWERDCLLPAMNQRGYEETIV
ncbi:hypothetical protein ACIQXW_23270 [Lysinibacillus sp. NPDC097162]|uniref:hypothetical protein n=1 Tax=Lysinibacillus sp. NPDC097162 TaxID=3364140 RepID=UPI0037F76159